MNNNKNNNNFNPKKKNKNKIIHFYQTLITKLYHHLNTNTNIPTNNIKINNHKINFITKIIKKLSNNTTYIFTNKNLSFNNNLIHPKTTNYNLIYFTKTILKHHNINFKKIHISISNSNNITQYTIKKTIKFNTHIITTSNSNNTIINKNKFTKKKLTHLIKIKTNHNNQITNYTKKFNLIYLKNQQP